MIPKRKSRPKMNVRQSDVIRCPQHLQWVRGHECSLAGKICVGPLGTIVGRHQCGGRMEAHHAHSVGAGGGDDETVSICSKGHRNLHDGFTFNVDLKAIAKQFWDLSPSGKKYRLTHAPPTGG